MPARNWNASGKMRVKTLLIPVCCVAGLALSAVPSAAQSVRLLGDFRDWSAYTTSEGAGKLCFVLSKPKEVSPTPDGYSEAYLYLTHRPAENVHNELNFVAGYGFAPETPATISIGGQSYPLFVEADAAWLEDPAVSDNIAGQMRAGSSVTIEGTTAQGIKITEVFSLSGITAASRAIDAECS
jgi:Invasion associated locus B (IalB) protein